MRTSTGILTSFALFFALAVCAQGQAMFFGGNGNTAAPPVSKFGTPAKVANNATGSATTLAAPAVNTANGDLMVVAAKSGSVAGTPSSVTDTAGDTYTPETTNVRWTESAFAVTRTLMSLLIRSSVVASTAVQL
jgi:hypothetical protein